MDNNKDMDTEAFLGVLNHAVHTDPFGNNKNGERAYRRLERIVAGVFLVTNHMGSDPLKQEIRANSTRSLRQLLALRDQMRNASSQKMTDLFSTLRNAVSLIRLLALSGNVSLQNAEVLISAIDDFGAYLSASMRSPLSETRYFSKEDFIAGHESPSFYKGHKKDIKDIRIEKDNSSLASGTVRAPISNRTATILDILKRHKDLSIKDVAMHVPEYGEKTIQRELSSLIETGLIKRTGLKRWSKYSLNEEVEQRDPYAAKKD